MLTWKVNLIPARTKDLTSFNIAISACEKNATQKQSDIRHIDIQHVQYLMSICLWCECILHYIYTFYVITITIPGNIFLVSFEKLRHFGVKHCHCWITSMTYTGVAAADQLTSQLPRNNWRYHATMTKKLKHTPWKFSIAPEKTPSQKERLVFHHFSGVFTRC